MNKVYTGVAVGGIALVAVAAWWLQRPAPPKVPAAAASSAPVAAGPASAVGAGAAGGAPGGVASVEVARAEALTIVDDVQAVGSLKARQGVMVRPEVSGRIARLGFIDGRPVRAGQLLVQLDDTLQRAQLEQAKAQASIARTNLQRSRELLAQSFVSQSAVDQNAAALQVADAQVALAEAQLARMRIVAPFDGTAGLRLVDVGDYLKDGADIVKVEDLSALEVEFALPERYVARTRPGLAMELTLDAMPGAVFAGQVLALNSQVDANGRALTVRARVQNPGAVLKPGMFARPRIIFSRREGAVAVPEEALVPLGTKQYLYKVVTGADGRAVAERIEARIGLRVPGKVEILEGLRAGDVVVTAGQARLPRPEGTPVRTIDLSQALPGTRPASGAAGAASAGSAGSAGSAASAANAVSAANAATAAGGTAAADAATAAVVGAAGARATPAQAAPR